MTIRGPGLGGGACPELTVTDDPGKLQSCRGGVLFDILPTRYFDTIHAHFYLSALYNNSPIVEVNRHHLLLLEHSPSPLPASWARLAE